MWKQPCVKFCTCITLHSEAQTFNWRNKRKNTFLPGGLWTVYRDADTVYIPISVPVLACLARDHCVHRSYAGLQVLSVAVPSIGIKLSRFRSMTIIFSNTTTGILLPVRHKSFMRSITNVSQLVDCLFTRRPVLCETFLKPNQVISIPNTTQRASQQKLPEFFIFLQKQNYENFSANP